MKNRDEKIWEKWVSYLLSEIPTDKEINKSPKPNYARPYYQGKFDVLMDLLKRIRNHKER